MVAYQYCDSNHLMGFCPLVSGQRISLPQLRHIFSLVLRSSVCRVDLQLGHILVVITVISGTYA